MSPPIARARLALAPVDDGYLAYDLDAHRLHRLNGSAALILELCDGVRTALQIETALAAVLGTGVSGSWIEAAARDGLVTTAGAAAPMPDTVDLAARARDLRHDGHVLAAFVCRYHAALETPLSAEHWLELGELAHIIGKRSVAREAYERYLELAPGNAEVEHILISLRDEPTPVRAPDQAIEQLYARFADFYEDNVRGELGYCGPELLAAALAPELENARGLDILDLGCGTGLAGKQLAPWARSLIGVDLSPQMTAHAATGLYDRIDVAEITAWLQQAGTADFDLIVACDTLIYFGDLAQVLVPAARRLRNDGLLAFTVEEGAESAFALTDSGRYAHGASHLRSAAAQAGLSIVSLRNEILRQEYGEPVAGLVAVTKKAPGYCPDPSRFNSSNQFSTM